MYKFLTFTVLSALFILSCANAPDRPEPILDPNAVPTPVSTTAATPPATAEPAQNAQGVWHYTCTNGCAGGAGSAVACATCGTTLVHNQIYHNNAAAPTAAGAGLTTPAATTGAASPISLGGNSAITPLGGAPTTAAAPPPKAPEPAQNAAGVWHYTCSAGCSGGAGSAIACATCGTTLVHNQVYHQ